MKPFNAGKLVLAEALERGRCPQVVMNEACKKMLKEEAGVVSVCEDGRQFYAGVVNALLDVYTEVAASGCVPEYVDKEVNELMHAGPVTLRTVLNEKIRAGEKQFFDVCLATIAQCVKDSGITVRRAKPAPQATPAAQGAMDVRVVGMPDRVTESSVAYDQDGNVKSTTQVEKDAATA